MSDALAVDLWSDLIRPFCYPGRRQLARALEQFEQRECVVIEHHDFELDPHSPTIYDATLVEWMAARYELPLETAIALDTTQGLFDELVERYFRAYVSEGELMSDQRRLSELATEVGVTDVAELWVSDACATNVRDDEARALGITRVPTFFIDAQVMIVGAQGPREAARGRRHVWALQSP